MNMARDCLTRSLRGLAESLARALSAALTSHGNVRWLNGPDSQSLRSDQPEVIHDSASVDMRVTQEREYAAEILVRRAGQVARWSRGNAIPGSR